MSIDVKECQRMSIDVKECQRMSIDTYTILYYTILYYTILFFTVLCYHFKKMRKIHLCLPTKKCILVLVGIGGKIKKNIFKKSSLFSLQLLFII